MLVKRFDLIPGIEFIEDRSLPYEEKNTYIGRLEDSQ